MNDELTGHSFEVEHEFTTPDGGEFLLVGEVWCEGGNGTPYTYGWESLAVFPPAAEYEWADESIDGDALATWLASNTASAKEVFERINDSALEAREDARWNR